MRFNFIKRVRWFFMRMDGKINGYSNDFCHLADMIVRLQSQVEDLKQRQHSWFATLNDTHAEAAKRLSSIEMEMLMARSACLDNSFEGKVDL